MAREPNIPLFLWVAAAIVAHLTWGGGAEQVAEVFEERADVRRFAASIQHQLRQRFNTEVALLDESTLPPLEHDEQRDHEGEPDPTVAELPKPEQVKAEDKKREDDKKAEDTPEAEKKKLASKEPPPKPEQKAEKPKPEEPKKEEEKKEQQKAQVAPPAVDTRKVAVVQHVEDEKQADNPEAEFLAEHNNRVREQTQASITATDQDNEKPTPGSQHMGPTDNPGDSHVTDIAQSDDAPGEVNRAPSEDKLAGEKKKAEVSVSQPNGIPEVAGRVHGGPQKNDPGEKGQTAQNATRAEEAVPPVANSPDGAWQVAGEREAQAARAAREARRQRAAMAAGTPNRPLDFLGLGATGRTELGVNLNLTPGTALAAIGQDQLAKEIHADGERRRSQHQGSWKAVGIERWRPAIENYVASVKLGNQTALNTAAVPFATYLNHIHNRLHPIFALGYLDFLDGLPGSAGLHDNDMATNLEIVLSQANGSIVKMGVTRTSGVTAFDIAALDSVQRASPFGAPPPSIVSPDGNVYLHWEFHRNPLLACSTYFARPFILKVPQKSAPPANEPPGGPFGPEEGAPPAKQGYNEPSDRQREDRDRPGAVREKTARLTSYAAP
ncbi:MAG TPA: hypothetical protein VFS67_16880 [Polyangiaceae bacterium]|nr:hypothetical protein [Polyangiaceae bacterium]